MQQGLERGVVLGLGPQGAVVGQPVEEGGFAEVEERGHGGEGAAEELVVQAGGAPDDFVEGLGGGEGHCGGGWVDGRPGGEGVGVGNRSIGLVDWMAEYVRGGYSDDAVEGQKVVSGDGTSGRILTCVWLFQGQGLAFDITCAPVRYGRSKRLTFPARTDSATHPGRRQRL